MRIKSIKQKLSQKASTSARNSVLQHVLPKANCLPKLPSSILNLTLESPEKDRFEAIESCYSLLRTRAAEFRAQIEKWSSTEVCRDPSFKVLAADRMQVLLKQYTHDERTLLDAIRDIYVVLRPSAASSKSAVNSDNLKFHFNSSFDLKINICKNRDSFLFGIFVKVNQVLLQVEYLEALNRVKLPEDSGVYQRLFCRLLFADRASEKPHWCSIVEQI